MRRLVLVTWLTAVWCLLWADAHPGTVLAGLLVALAISQVVTTPDADDQAVAGSHPPLRHVIRPVHAARFLRWFAVALVKSTWSVAREAVTPGSTIRAGIVAVPIHGPTPLLTTMVANTITLTPGTLTVEAVPDDDGRHTTLHVHALHLTTPEELTEEVALIEALVVRAFGPSEVVAVLEEPLPRRVAARSEGGDT